MEQLHKFNSDKKLEWWGYGEWVEEPDVIKFIYRDLQCCIRRTAVNDNGYIFGGHLCGYVELPKNHPWEGHHAMDIDVEVHGGLSFSEGTEDLWLIGFDCGHSGDLVPSIEKMKANEVGEEFFDRYRDSMTPEIRSLFIPVYKNIQFVMDECKLLANQIILEEARTV